MLPVVSLNENVGLCRLGVQWCWSSLSSLFTCCENDRKTSKLWERTDITYTSPDWTIWLVIMYIHNLVIHVHIYMYMYLRKMFITLKWPTIFLPSPFSYTCNYPFTFISVCVNPLLHYDIHCNYIAYNVNTMYM